ncbi:proteasome component C5 [Penicillium chermesinum]|nr:proteasome component C5 [Penicillium chermesinum]
MLFEPRLPWRRHWLLLCPANSCSSPAAFILPIYGQRRFDFGYHWFRLCNSRRRHSLHIRLQHQLTNGSEGFKIGGDDETGEGAQIVLSVVGFAADGNALKERLDNIVKMYKYKHGKPMSVSACAQRLSTILYEKRFFPYYVHAILGGLDEEGKGALYSYDPVGSYEREQCRAAGAASSLITPFLDNQVNFKNQYVPGSGEGHALEPKKAEPLSRSTAEGLVRDAFTSAVERHIEVGDYLQLVTITKDGIEEAFQPLKKD